MIPNLARLRLSRTPISSAPKELVQLKEPTAPPAPQPNTIAYYQELFNLYLPGVSPDDAPPPLRTFFYTILDQLETRLSLLRNEDVFRDPVLWNRVSALIDAGKAVETFLNRTPNTSNTENEKVFGFINSATKDLRQTTMAEYADFTLVNLPPADDMNSSYIYEMAYKSSVWLGEDPEDYPEVMTLVVSHVRRIRSQALAMDRVLYLQNDLNKLADIARKTIWRDKPNLTSEDINTILKWHRWIDESKPRAVLNYFNVFGTATLNFLWEENADDDFGEDFRDVYDRKQATEGESILATKTVTDSFTTVGEAPRAFEQIYTRVAIPMTQDNSDDESGKTDETRRTKAQPTKAQRIR